MPKYFPRTIDGDQLSVEFEYQEELDAFRAGVVQLMRMRDSLRRMEETEEFDVRHAELPYCMDMSSVKENVNLLTTLQIKVLNDHKDVVIKILGVHICNIFGRGSIHMSILTSKVKS
jgi:hypothetical protein